MTFTEKRAALAALYTELEAVQAKMKEGKLTQSEGEAAEAKAKEAEALQNEIDQFVRFEGITAKGKEPNGERVLPPTGDEAKAELTKMRGADGSPVIGFVSVGDAFVNSEEFKNFQKSTMPKQDGLAAVTFPGFADGFVPITAKQAEAKAITFTGAVVAPERLAEVVRRPENDRLTLRDVLRTGRTNSNSVEFMIRSAFTNAAATVADNAAKPESAFTYEPATAPVRTLAHWTAVTEQQLQDAPQLMGMIDDDLLYGLGRVEETQALWGAGTGTELLGIFNVPGVNVGRTVGGDTLIDQIRRMITDVAVAGAEANGVVIHPYDWENIQLLKGTDNTYVWVIVTDPATGQNRIWGLNVVESVAAAEPGAYTTNERRVLVGDFRRGAALLDKQDATVQVGWINDQFIRNQRTIRAEERVALPVFMPAAFRYRISQARVV